jgi:plasmid stabilization system protein ParE
MASRVEIAPRAFHDLDEIAGYIEQQASFEQAEQWFNGMIAAITALGEFPHRCPITDESRALGYEVRVLLHGKRNRQFKVFHSVQQKTPSTGSVRVFHVRRWARTRLPTDALRELIAKPAE